jgi:hypothetical protein
MRDAYERTGRQSDVDGVDLTPNDPLPDVPDAGDDSVPITSPDPVDFSTAGVTAAGAAGMSTFNDGDDRGLFERTVDVFEQEGIEPPMLGDAPDNIADALPRRRARIYPTQ